MSFISATNLGKAPKNNPMNKGIIPLKEKRDVNLPYSSTDKNLPAKS